MSDAKSWAHCEKHNVDYPNMEECPCCRREMGEFEKRLMPLSDMTTSDHILISRKELRGLLDAVEKEYPKVSQKWVPVKGRRVDWKILCLQMEQKIIAFENFGKKWFGEQK